MVKKNGAKGSSEYPDNFSSQPQHPLSLNDTIRCVCSNFKYTTILCWFKLKKQTNISILKFRLEKKKRNFGTEYLTLVCDNAPVKNLTECLREALEETDNMMLEIEDILAEIYMKELRVNSKMRPLKPPETQESDEPASKKQQITRPEKVTTTKTKYTKKRRKKVEFVDFGYTDDDDSYDPDSTVQTASVCDSKREIVVESSRRVVESSRRVLARCDTDSTVQTTSSCDSKRKIVVLNTGRRT